MKKDPPMKDGEIQQAIDAIVEDAVNAMCLNITFSEKEAAYRILVAEQDRRRDRDFADKAIQRIAAMNADCKATPTMAEF